MSEALLSALAEAVAELATAHDPGADGPGLADTARLLDGLPAADRRTLDGLFRAAALRQPPGPRRERFLKVPAGLGLSGDAHLARCDRAAGYVESFVTLVRDADPATPVPSCPGWSLADLVRHHGATHRRTEHLVRTRATGRVRSADVPLDLPADPAGYPDWLAESAKRALRVLREAEPDAPVWVHGGDPHVRFYPRRLLFEAVVRLADAELALGREPAPVDPATAGDGVEEFLENLPYFSWAAEPVAQLDRDGASLRLTATDTGAAWTITLGGGGFAWRRRAEGEPTAGVAGTAADLLLLLHGRYAADAPRFDRSGDRTLLDAWIASTALQAPGR
ncbi:maleylpyruvate isomerase N-terminal domain-containing protein [Streptomyces sp. NPDC093111]|uniref:maleylpyruvate isomerase N-terminal domain-containing protein n=1 Tax=Streptomyces sp. NPDC093111 TaxID=3154978 RepID=UPI0034372C62